MAYSKYDKPYGQHFIEFISKDQAVLAGNEKVRSKLNFIGLQIDLITDLVYEYTNSANVSLDTDDEIINWTFPDVNSDLIGAAWNLNSNLYKITGVCLRNAYEMSFVALYFQISWSADRVSPFSGAPNTTKKRRADRVSWGYLFYRPDKATCANAAHGLHRIYVAQAMNQAGFAICRTENKAPAAASHPMRQPGSSGQIATWADR